MLKEVSIKAKGKERKNIEQVIRYLGNNAEGLKDYRIDLFTEGKDLRGLGAIESNVDKVVANRMKKRGISWTTAGARSMTCLLVLSLENKLAEATRQTLQIKEKVKVSLKKLRRQLVKSCSEWEGEWLQARMPALYGPHQARPWVKYLKSLSEVSIHVLFFEAFFISRPTKS